jgi:hypothetical protein
MTDNEQQKQESLSVGSLTLRIVGGALGFYLAGFALLALIPELGLAIGLSPVTFEKIYYPILKSAWTMMLPNKSDAGKTTYLLPQ